MAAPKSAELSPQDLMARISGGRTVPAIVLLGSDSYLREMCRNGLIDAYVPANTRDWALGRLSARGGGWFEAFERAQTLPMMSPRQVLIVEEVEAIEELGEKSRDAAVDALEKYLADPAPFTVLVFEASALDKRLRLFKALSKNSNAVLIVELVMDRAQAEALAVSTATELGVSMDREAAGLLADAVNGEAARIRVEVEKLSLYAQAAKKISSRDVEDLVVDARKHTVWQLAEMLAGSRREAALEFLDCLLRDGEQPAMLVGGLAWMYRKLIEVRELPVSADAGQVSYQLRMQRDSAAIALREGRRFTHAQLMDGIAALADADSLLKSGVKDQRAVLEFLFSRLTTKSRAA
jgi:DNA polymerase III subunit delta